jgi:hypothetical protein
MAKSGGTWRRSSASPNGLLLSWLIAAADNKLFKVFAYFPRFWRAMSVAALCFICPVKVDDSFVQ